MKYVLKLTRLGVREIRGGNAYGTGALASVRNRRALGAFPQRVRHPGRDEPPLRQLLRPASLHRSEHACVGARVRHVRDEGRARAERRAAWGARERYLALDHG